MKRKRFTTDQITAALKEHEAGVPATELCRKLGIAGCPSPIRWRSRRFLRAKSRRSRDAQHPSRGGVGVLCGMWRAGGCRWGCRRGNRMLS